MAALPVELDFTRDRSATPERMDRAMEYLVARLRAVEAVQPEFLSKLDELKAVGLVRVTEVLAPLFDGATATRDAIEAILADLQSNATREAVVEDVTAEVVEAFADYRHRYLGAKSSAPAVRDDGTAVAVGDMYFDTALDAMRVLGTSGWKNAGSSVAGIMNQLAPIVATAGQTVFAIPGGYDVGYLILTVNGVVIPPADYTATNGTSVTLAAGLSAGDELAGIAFGAVTLSTVYTKAQVDAGFMAITAAYTKAQVDTLLASKANASAVYTKAEANGQFANLSFSNLTDAGAARGNLGIGSAGTRADSFFVKVSDAKTGAFVNIKVGTSAPASPAVGDLWVDTN